MGHQLLDRAFALVETLGLPLVAAAWLTVFLGAIGMALVLRRRDLKGCLAPAAVVGALALAAHLLDYAVTLRITPDLSMEANPIWRIVIDRLGLAIAKAYGLSGKILVSVLSFELYAFYLSQRRELLPARADGFRDFVARLGKDAGRLANVRSFFAFAFALFGPYFFYITFMNLSGDDEVFYEKLPSPPVAIVAYFSAVTAAYFAAAWRAFQRRPLSSGTTPT
jgi:hypothetical protein